MSSDWLPQLSAPSKAQCAEVKARWPTLLGVDPWSCYWEWVLADVGFENAYMHRPLYWATLQLARGEESTCGQIEWPGRYIARLILIAQRGHKAMHGVFTNSSHALLGSCALVDGCKQHCGDLTYALVDGAPIFLVSMEAKRNGSRSIFAATIEVTTPTSQSVPSFTYVVSIDSNSKLDTWYPRTNGTSLLWPHVPSQPCLFTSNRISL